MKKLFLMSVFVALSWGMRAEMLDIDDGVDRKAPDFVTASLLWIGPGREFFGCAGHSSIRLQCPSYKLDYCFSCESERIRDNVWRFVRGELKTGMFAIPTQEFLKSYGLLDRGCRQYKLQLPPDVKQRLWKILDRQVAEGQCLPYDYIKYCCVQTMLQPLLQSVGPHRLELAPWSDVYKLTRREVLADDLAWCPWTRLFLHTIAGTEVDREVSEVRRIILSRDLLAFLRGARIDGLPIIAAADDGEVVLPFHELPPKAVITPPIVAAIFVMLAIFGCFTAKPYVEWLFLSVQTVLGLLLTHLVFASTLPATDWNWLLIPFNPLPLVFWKWRRHWALPFAVVLVGWLGFMLLAPHRLTDSAYYVLVSAYVLVYAHIGWPRRHAF